MINVNWQKIKPYEKRNFAITAMLVEIFLFIAFITFGFTHKTDVVILKDLTALMLVAMVAHFVHIESRMFQIYLLFAIADIALLFAAILPLPKMFVVAVFVIFVIASFGVAIATLIAEKYIKTGTKYDCSEPDRSSVFGNKNVLFFAPHEDDEINLYGGIIEQYVKNKSTVRIVFSTNGDCYGIGKIRISEALNVADTYGIPRENIIFLGYSDSLKNKDNKHIYNCDDNEIVESIKGYSITYGTGEHPSYSNCQFTRTNIVNDFKNVILDYMPDTIYCCDYDSHLDHRAIGLFCEESLDLILKEHTNYHPEVLKGFAYSMAWIGKLDYYNLNSRSTHQHEPSPYMSETNVYSWTDRVRVPVAKDALSRVMQNSSSYLAMMKYSSQTATDHANGILNSDKVFWRRRCDSLLYNAQIKSTSGDASKLTCFKLVDSDNINSGSELPCSNAWVADANDENRIVAIKLDEVKQISSVVLYDSPLPDNHIESATLKIGNIQFETGELKENGGATIFEFPPIESDTMAIKINKFKGACSLLKIEAFEQPENDSPNYIKLVNSTDDFCYDYFMNKSGEEQFTVYSYPFNDNLEFELNTTGEIEASIDENNVITIKCPEGKHGKLTVGLKSNPFVFDIVTFSNPSQSERAKLIKKQNLEQKFWSFPMQWDYYYGLVKRLAIYR